MDNIENQVEEIKIKLDDIVNGEFYLSSLHSDLDSILDLLVELHNDVY